MPGNYGPPPMRFKVKRRTDTEIVWADGLGVRIGSTFGFVIATVVSAGFISVSCSLIGSLITDRTARENLTKWDGGALLFYLAGAFIPIGGAVFCVWAWSAFARNLVRCYAREEWHLSPSNRCAEFYRKPVFRKLQREVFDAETVTAVLLGNESSSERDERHWGVWLDCGDAGKRLVDHGGGEANLRQLAADFAATFGLPVST